MKCLFFWAISSDSVKESTANGFIGKLLVWIQRHAAAREWASSHIKMTNEMGCIQMQRANRGKQPESECKGVRRKDSAKRQTNATKYYIFCLRNRRSNKIIFSRLSVDPVRNVFCLLLLMISVRSLSFAVIALFLCRLSFGRYHTPCGERPLLSKHFDHSLLVFGRAVLWTLCSLHCEVCECAFLFNFSCEHRLCRRDVFFSLHFIRFAFFSPPKRKVDFGCWPWKRGQRFVTVWQFRSSCFTVS